MRFPSANKAFGEQQAFPLYDPMSLDTLDEFQGSCASFSAVVQSTSAAPVVKCYVYKPDSDQETLIQKELLEVTEKTLERITKIKEEAFAMLQFFQAQEEELDRKALAKISFTTQAGHQIVDYNDGSKYKGELDTNRVRHGKGIYYYPSGTVYKGQWVNGGRDGLGICDFVSQNKYVGYWQQGRREGLGVFMFTKERKIIDLPASFPAALPNLKSPIIDPMFNSQYDDADKERYEGEFLHDQRHGFGVYYFPDGSCYAGFWQHNRRHGKGTYHFTSGRVYVGEWKNSQREGYGIMKDNTGQVMYKGYWANDRKEGKGVQYENGDWVTAIWKANKLEKILLIELFPFKHRLKAMLEKEPCKTEEAWENTFRDVSFIYQA